MEVNQCIFGEFTIKNGRLSVWSNPCCYEDTVPPHYGEFLGVGGRPAESLAYMGCCLAGAGETRMAMWGRRWSVDHGGRVDDASAVVRSIYLRLGGAAWGSRVELIELDLFGNCHGPRSHSYTEWVVGDWAGCDHTGHTIVAATIMFHMGPYGLKYRAMEQVDWRNSSWTSGVQRCHERHFSVERVSHHGKHLQTCRMFYGRWQA